MKNLKIKIDLEKSSAVLLTQRLIKQSLISFFSNLAGSVLGIMSLIGFIMNMIEPKYEDYLIRRKNRRTINQIRDTGNHIKKVNFNPVKLDYIDPNVEHRIFDHQATLENIMNISLQDKVQTETNLDTFKEVGVIDRLSYNGALNGSNFISKKGKIIPMNNYIL